MPYFWDFIVYLQYLGIDYEPEKNKNGEEIYKPGVVYCKRIWRYFARIYVYHKFATIKPIPEKFPKTFKTETYDYDTERYTLCDLDEGGEEGKLGKQTIRNFKRAAIAEYEAVGEKFFSCMSTEGRKKHYARYEEWCNDLNYYPKNWVLGW